MGLLEKTAQTKSSRDHSTVRRLTFSRNDKPWQSLSGI